MRGYAVLFGTEVKTKLRRYVTNADHYPNSWCK